MELILHEFDLPLEHPFTIARGTITSQPTLIVELREDGRCGFGEAPATGYYGATVENVRAAIEAIRGEIESCSMAKEALMPAPFTVLPCTYLPSLSSFFLPLLDPV